MHFPWILKLNFILRIYTWNVSLNISFEQYLKPYPKNEINI